MIGASYYNPTATGTSPDAQQAFVSAALQRISPQNTISGSALNVSPVSGASISNLGSPSGSGIGSILGGALGGGQSGGNISSILGGLGTAANIAGGIGQLALGFKAAKLAKRNFNFQVDAYNNNLQNTTQSYNTALEDRIRARHNTEGRS